MSGDLLPSTRELWKAQTVAVNLWDLHVLLAFAFSTGESGVLNNSEVDTLNRVVDACNSAKDL